MHNQEEGQADANSEIEKRLGASRVAVVELENFLDVIDAADHRGSRADDTRMLASAQSRDGRGNPPPARRTRRQRTRLPAPGSAMCHIQTSMGANPSWSFRP